MTYHIDSIEFFVRETKPARFPSALGKAARSDQAPHHVTSPLCHAKMIIRDDRGNRSFGCSADRLSVRWLDKRPGRDIGLKRRELTALIHTARPRYLAAPDFESPFAYWRQRHAEIMEAGRAADHLNPAIGAQTRKPPAWAVEALDELASLMGRARQREGALERAMLDGVCRLSDKSMFEMLREDRLGFRPGQLHHELQTTDFRTVLPQRPVTEINIRHTVGIFDPLTDEDWPASESTHRNKSQ